MKTCTKSVCSLENSGDFNTKPIYGPNSVLKRDLIKLERKLLSTLSTQLLERIAAVLSK
jgi:hypothetical protein